MNSKAIPHARRAALAALVSLAVAVPGTAIAQQKASTARALEGHWTVVSVTDGDGKPSASLGENPKGLFIYDRSGRYSIQLFRSDLPKFAGNSRTKGTPEENQKVVHGSLAHFGTWKVNEKDGTFTVKPEACTFPNWNGVEQPARKFEVSGDTLKIMNPAPSTGAGGTTTLVLKRVK